MGAPLFDDLLDEHISAAPPLPSRPRTAGPTGTAVTYGFFFDAASATPGISLATRRSPPVVERAGEQASIVRGFRIEVLDPNAGTAVHHRAPLRPEPDFTTPASEEPGPRLLSAGERAALAVMNSLGASLAPGFTSRELRRAFRRLALRYHPDRHASRSADERAQLSDRFTRAREAYQLLVVVSRRGCPV
jgi:hypothetical protein